MGSGWVTTSGFDNPSGDTLTQPAHPIQAAQANKLETRIPA